MSSLPATCSRNDRLLATLSLASLAVVMLAFGYLLLHIVTHGVAAIDIDFIFQNPLNAGRDGGIASVLLSTALILLCCMAVVIPVGLAAAMLLHVQRHEHSIFWRSVRISFDVLASAPSIVFGLFGNAFFSIYLHMGFSILSGGLTLACMVLPFFIRSCENIFNALPARLHTQSRALGVGVFTYSTRILLPVCLPGVIVALIISSGRALAETAALVFTSGYVLRMPESLLDSGRSLSVHILDLAMNVPGGNQHAYASALTLIFFLLVINLIAHQLGRSYTQKRSQWS